jgi:hypothetical protein
MIEKIKENIGNPAELEKLYRTDHKLFESAFNSVYGEIANHEIAKFWKCRLDFDSDKKETARFSWKEIFEVAVVCLFAAILIRIPGIFHFSPAAALFYEKNAMLTGFLALTTYMIIYNRVTVTWKLWLVFSIFALLALYVNLLPPGKEHNSITLVYIHLPMLLWYLLAFVYSGLSVPDRTKLFDFIRYNGDLAVISGLIAIAGGMLTGITIGLFRAIGLNIANFYVDNVVVAGMVSVPVVATYIIRKQPSLTSRIAPIIASIFSPLVLLSAVVFLVAFAFSGKDPYNDRDFLLIFNIMLAGVMAIILFSVSGASSSSNRKFSDLVLFLLSVFTIIIDLIALSAIFYRLGEYGISPNRIAVLGSNLLIFVNLILVMTDLFRINFRRLNPSTVESTIAGYVPVYIIWAFIVTFGFPLLFGMK